MRKIVYKLSLLVTGCILLFSCQDELNQEPTSTLTPDSFYSSLSDFQLAAEGLYPNFASGAYYGGSFISRPDIMSDNLITSPAGRLTNLTFFQWQFTSNTTWGLMSTPYIITNRANLIVNNIDVLPDSDDKNDILGQAKAARALAMFDMLRVYCEIPTEPGVNMATSLGMPVVTESGEPNLVKLRPSLQESYDFVVNELEDAADLIADFGDERGTKFNKQAVYGLLSRVYLYLGQYQNAVNAANQVTQPIAELSSFPAIWTDSQDDGVLLKIDQDRTLDQIGIGIEFAQYSNGNVIPEFVMSYDLYQLYQSDDVRLNAYTSIFPGSNGNFYNAVIKYLGETGQLNGYVDPKLLRVAEVYLNKAEAQYMLGEEADALATLDELRSRRYGAFVAGTETGTALLDAIKLERRLELFCEGHRFFDLKRWNEPVSRDPQYGDLFDGTGSETLSNYLTLPTTSHRWNLAIPQGEINIYPEFQQNPGY